MADLHRIVASGQHVIVTIRNAQGIFEAVTLSASTAISWAENMRACAEQVLGNAPAPAIQDQLAEIRRGHQQLATSLQEVARKVQMLDRATFPLSKDSSEGRADLVRLYNQEVMV